MLATEPPTWGQRRLAVAIVAVLFAVFAATVAIGLTSPLARIPVRIDAFVPVLAALLFVNNSITAALLFGQFSDYLPLTRLIGYRKCLCLYRSDGHSVLH